MARIVVFAVLCALTECLEVTTSTTQTLALVDHDILLHCNFSYLEPIKAEDVLVKWTVRRDTTVKSVYIVDGVNINSLRPGSYMDLQLLKFGNASLYLSKLTLEDEGEYTCTVLISPELGSNTFFLSLAAQPTITLLPENSQLISGEMKTFICKLSHFYPHDIDIKWIVKQEKKEIVLTKDICTGIPFQDENGTFMVDSQVSIVFTKEDDGSAILCEVRHQSLPQPLRKDTTIYITAVKDPGNLGFVISTLVIVLLLILASALLYWRFLASVPPRVSELILPELNMEGEKMVAICNINGFRPKAVDISWYIEKNDQGIGYSEDDVLLQATDITSHAKHPVSKHGSLFNATSQLSYTPSVQDDGATIVCVVSHKALGAIIRRKSHINVAVRPKKSYITSWPQNPKRGDKLTLSCIVERFYPKPIALTWMRNGQVHSDITQFGPFPCKNEYYSIWSQIDLTLAEEEDGVIYTCQIRHLSLRSIEELSYEINVKGTPPEVQFIAAEPITPVIGQEVLLSCKISNFFPRDIVVNWYKDGIKLVTGVCHSLCVNNTSGAHSMWSYFKFTPTAEDDGSVFSCSVQHAALKNHEERTYTMRIKAKSDLM